jgi:hypothetical protein
MREQTARFSGMINDALRLAAQLRSAPQDLNLQSELHKLSRNIMHEGAAGNLHVKLTVPEGANARISRHYSELIDEHPREFIADRLSRIDDAQADFYSLKDPLVYLTSFDFNLRAEPYLPEAQTAE